MIPELIVIALIVGWLSGGKFLRLADIHIKHVWLLAVTLFLYFAAWGFRLKLGTAHFEWLYGAMFIASRLALLGLVVANIRVPGAKLILIGMVLNLIAITSNHCTMPARAEAIGDVYGSAYLAYFKTAPHIQSALLDASSKAKFLCDNIAMRKPYALVPEVVSVGDVTMSVGILLAIVGIMRTPLPKEKVFAKTA